MKIHTAKKNHRCTECGKLIPVGVKYWRDYEEGGDNGMLKDEKVHTNCLEFEDQPEVSIFDIMKLNKQRRK